LKLGLAVAAATRSGHGVNVLREVG
jgi:hypothetical protein